jgi:hypothetical protein
MARSVGSGGRAGGWAFCLSVVAGLLALGSCFSPHQPPCAFTCVSAGNLCPDSYTCGADGLCHREGAEDACTLVAPYGGASGHGVGGAGGSGAGGGGATGSAGAAGSAGLGGAGGA